MKKLNRNLNVKIKFSVHLPPEFRQNQCGSFDTASSGWRWVAVTKLNDDFQFPSSKHT